MQASKTGALPWLYRQAERSEMRSLTISASIDYCRQFARSHYENFPVASRLLPGSIRDAIVTLYTFARIADDIVDENQQPTLAQSQLDAYRHDLAKTLSGKAAADAHWPALAYVVEKHNLSNRYLYDLLDAFNQDLRQNSYQNWGDVYAYCRKSANPIGRLLLQLHGGNTLANCLLSDHICTGLQLINFWQDLPIDLNRGRIYIPQTVWEASAKTPYPEVKLLTRGERENMVAQLLLTTSNEYAKGKLLARMLQGHFAHEIRFIYCSGAKVLRKLGGMRSELFQRRPQLQRGDFLSIAGCFLRG
jgi:squalene synthase HpnC